MPPVMGYEMYREFQMIFNILDWDDKGYLTSHQLSAIMKQYGYVHKQEDIQQMIDLVDCDGTGHMGFATFCSALLACRHMTKSPRSL